MSDKNSLGPWIRRFLSEYLVEERGLARNTQASYRDTLALLLPWTQKSIHKPVDQLHVLDISADVVRGFLTYLEQQRRCSIQTRNVRLAALHSLARFIGERSPDHVAWCSEVRSVPFKKTVKPTLGYLDKPEMDALLNAPDPRTPQGFRDYALLLFLYNTGARADEASRLTLADLDLGRSPFVKILGKGNKTRLCPLWPLTAETLRRLIQSRSTGDRVFLNRRQQPFTRFGIRTLVKRSALAAASKEPSLHARSISPHTIRHTTAVHLLRAGVDINTIRAWLNHSSLETTNIYAEVDLEMKAKALAHCELFAQTPQPSRSHEPGLMTFLKNLGGNGQEGGSTYVA